MTIAEVYREYRIPKVLQEHLLRVAGVAALYLEYAPSRFDRPSVLTACLLHDMANIIKFNLSKFPEFLEPEGVAYWSQVQAEFIAKYGREEHEANVAIARELGVSTRVKELIGAVGFSQTESNFLSGDMEKMLCEYADDRVTPWGIVSLEERIEDLRVRYSAQYPGSENELKRQRFAEFARKIEHKLFSIVEVPPSAMTDANVAQFVPELLDWPIP